VAAADRAVSGVVAVLARGGAPADAALLARMIEAQRFRGPDGEGAWVRGAVGLGHALHRTTLESAREVSPATLDDRLFVTADARIDARDELCARLRDHGRDLPLDLPDPLLILHAYDAWGEGALTRLLGDFSFALWDEPRRRLVCAVDALGTRPFYYADRAGLFVGANSLRCVRLHAGVRDALNEEAVGDFLMAGTYEDRGATIFADVARVPPGHLLVVPEDGEPRLERYFEWPRRQVSAAAPVRGERADELRELLGRAVRDRLRTAKVSIYLSGGVDSPLVALTAKRELARGFAAPELRAYCEVYDHLVPDEERRYAGLVARSLGIPIDYQAMDEGGLLDWVGRLAPPQPIADSGLRPLLDQLDRLASHSPVALTGYDGDALLASDLRLHWWETLKARRPDRVAREVGWYLLTQRRPPPLGVRTFLARRRRAGAALERPPWVRATFWERAGLEARWRRLGKSAAPTWSREPAVRGLGRGTWGAVFDGYDPETLGRPIDVRHPLMDLRVVRFALGLPAVPWCVDKHLFRLCLDGMPSEVRRRPKAPLAADPVAALAHRRGLGELRARASSPRLEPFVDVGALEVSLARGPGEDPWPLLRAVALGAWLADSGARV
jgi:asparagine synthase (glutamine-hydrolysing)